MFVTMSACRPVTCQTCSHHERNCVEEHCTFAIVPRLPMPFDRTSRHTIMVLRTQLTPRTRVCRILILLVGCGLFSDVVLWYDWGSPSCRRQPRKGPRRRSPGWCSHINNVHHVFSKSSRCRNQSSNNQDLSETLTSANAMVVWGYFPYKSLIVIARLIRGNPWHVPSLTYRLGTARPTLS